MLDTVGEAFLKAAVREHRRLPEAAGRTPVFAGPTPRRAFQVARYIDGKLHGSLRERWDLNAFREIEPTAASVQALRVGGLDET